MAYTPTDPLLGIQPIAKTSTTQNHPLGMIVEGYDPTFGAGEFIYLVGVVSTVIGTLVVYNPLAGTTTLAPNTANLNQPVAVAMSANVAASYGWYQIEGCAVISKTATKVSPNVPIYLSATAGSVMATAASGKEVMNTRTVNAATVASAVATITALIDRPFAQGAVT
jgi:hypothetical protein